MMFGSVSLILVLAAIVVVALLVVRVLTNASKGPMPHDRAALDILRERFARGEIDKDEFEERRRVLNE